MRYHEHDLGWHRARELANLGRHSGVGVLGCAHYHRAVPAEQGRRCQRAQLARGQVSATNVMHVLAYAAVGRGGRCPQYAGYGTLDEQFLLADDDGDRGRPGALLG